MPQTIYLPASTDVVAKAFTNASYLQRVTLNVPGSSTPTVLQGSGEGNTPIGSTHFTTPPGGEAQLTVTIEDSSDGGQTWTACDIYTNSCAVQAYNLVVMATEDLVDADYNDTICMVSWPGGGSPGAEEGETRG